MALRPSPPPGGEGFRCMAQKTAPASYYGNRGGFILLMKFYVCSLKLSRNYLRGFLIAAWAAARRAIGTRKGEQLT